MEPILRLLIRNWKKLIVIYFEIMEDLEGLAEWLKTEKGITKLTLDELIDYIPEYELWKQRN